MTFLYDYKRFESHIAVHDADLNLTKTYGELERDIKHFQGLFSLSRKRLAICFCQNTYGAVVAYLASVRSDQAIILLNAALKEGLKSNVLSIYRPNYIFSVGKQPTYIPSGYHPTGHRLENAFAYETSDPEPSPVIHDDLSVLLPTSGTTGTPKMVKLTRANLEANARSIAEYLELDSREKPITYLPMHYCYGLSIINSHLMVGATLVLTKKGVLQREFWETFQAYGCTSFSGVPYAYRMLDRINLVSRQLPTLKAMTQSGGPLEPPQVEKYARYMNSLGGQFFVMYGQTEATARISYLPPDRAFEKTRSVGIAIPGGDLSIKTEDDRLTKEPNIKGEVVYQGPNVMMGYATSQEELGRPNEMHGVLTTGDLGYLDDEGFLYLTGRSKRIAKVFGLRINLDEVEAKVNQHSPSAVIGVTDTIVVFYEGLSMKEAERLKHELANEYTIHVSAFRFQSVDDI
ncbi:MAG: AMP-binding protein, partial [Planctomycetota bacterium]